MKLVQTLLALFACAFLPLHAASLDDLTYTTADGKVTITDCDEAATGELVIPATIEGNTVISIGISAFRSCNSLTSITIPDSVISIGNSAFRSCTSLESVTIGDGVTSIGLSAFNSCRSLTSVNIPDGVTSIANFAFYQCASLTSITIPDSVISIGINTFKNCRSLTSITIPDGVTSIGGGAFRGCTSLKSITFLGTVPTTVGGQAFASVPNGAEALVTSENQASFGDIGGDWNGLTIALGETTAPVITVTSGTDTVEQGATWTDAGATADGGETVTVSGTVDTDTFGIYTITYTATDASGNVGTATRTVKVADPVQDVYHYHYTGGVETFTVPAGITSISVDAYGASGTTGAGQAGKGGRVQANLTVTPGDTLYLYVGEAPHYLGYEIQPGGWNGGGDGPNTGNTGVGFPGGGATDIRIGGTGLNNRVIVAGGGGGKRNGSTYGGGHGGGLVGQNGGGGSNSGGPRYGAGGSQSSGGAGGYAWYGDGTPTYTIVPSSNGQLGQGGTGDTNSGGGGGGYYGGGGGADAGGGGGSSYTDPTLSSSVVHTQGVQTGSGQLTITVTQGDGPDAIRPVITVTSGVDTVLQGSTWTDAGATADTGETVTVVSNTVNTSAAGIYTVTYSATDAAGNVGTATRTVTVDLNTLNANGTAVQWAHTTGNDDGIHYDLAQPLELRAPPGYTVVLRNATHNKEYNTGLEYVPDVEALLVSTGNMNGYGYGGLRYRLGNSNWDHNTASYVAFARQLPDTTAPVITSGGAGIGNFENSGTGQSVYTIAASDAIGVVSYAIGGTDAALLTLTGNVVSLTADPDYEVQNSYSFTVTASDVAGNTSDPTTVTFSITDVDEIPPVITSGATGINLVENSGSGQTVYTITASDANGVVSYAIGGTDAASLTLTGNIVSLIADSDYEVKNSYSFTVTASDAAGNTSDPTTVTFSITDVDEVAPVITVTSGDSTVERAIGPSTVVSGGGRIWLDRNLGASQVATSTTDAAAYGDLFQWGRLADGHEDPNSNTTSTLGSSSNPGNSSFILTSSDWLETPDVNLWQGADGGVNNVCPPGFRLPTKAEWEIEIASWSSSDAAGAFASPLKLTLAPYRSNYDGSTTGQNNGYGMYWSSTVNGNYTNRLRITSSSAVVSQSHRGAGHSVRCIKDENIILGWTDAGATADGGETVIASGTVDINTVGTYTITYTATDAAGNTGTATRTVTVVEPDTTAPVITVTSGTDTVEQGGAWTDAGATADGNEAVTASGGVDINTVGTYTITYTATDAAGNVGTVTRTVTVVAPVAPPTVKNAHEIQIDANTNIALDSTVGDVGGVWPWYSNGVASDPSNSLSVFLEGVRDADTHRMNHNASNPGSLGQTSGTGTSDYTYTGIPGSGNDDSAKGVVLKYTATEERELLIETTGSAYNDSVVVIFTEAHLHGGSAPFRVVTMDSGDATTFKVKFPYSANNSDENIYYIAFTSYNESDLGSSTPLKITANALDTTPPVITVTSGTDTVEQGGAWTDAGATADGNEAVTASGGVDINTVGTYTITYTATDAAGNVGTVTRTVTVVAPVAPPTVKNAHEIQIDANTNIALDSTVGDVGGVWPWYSNGVASDPSNSLSVFLEGVRDADTHRMNHNASNPGSLGQTSGTGTSDYTYTGIPGSGNDDSAKGVVLKYTATEERELLIETTGSAYNDSVVVIFTEAHLHGGSAPFRVVTMDSGDATTFKVKFPYSANNSDENIYYIAFTSYNESDLGSSTPLKITANALDTTPPVITVTSGTDTVEQGGAWTDAGATADGNEAVTASGGVDINTVGTYTITYTATDAAGNVGTVTRTVTVVAPVAPPTVKNAHEIQIDANTNIALDSTVGDVGGVWPWYSNGVASDPSNSLSVFLEGVRDADTHRMNHNASNPGSLGQTSGTGTSDYTYTGIPGSGNDDSAKGVVLKYTATEERELLIETTGSAYNDSVVVIFTEAHLHGGSAPFRVVTMDSGDATTFKVKFPYSANNSDENIYYIAFTSYNESDLGSSTPLKITANALDTTPPVITVTSGTDTVEQGGAWTDAGATADGNEAVTASGGVDINTVGTYTITYTATDAAGNVGTVTRTVTVVAPVAPPTVKNAHEIQIDANTNIALDSTVGDVGGVWPWYSNGVASDPSNSLSVFLEGVRDADTHRMNHNASNPGSLGQTSGTGTSDYTYTGIPGSGNDDSAKGVVLKYTATEERELLIETTGSAYNDSVVVIFTEAHLHGGSAPFRVVTMDSGDATTFKVKFPYSANNSDENIYYIAFTSYNESDLGSSTPLKITANALDTTPPVITVTSGTDTVEQGGAWTDAGATADGNEAVTASGTVDTSTVGTYTITYNATDAAGNVGTATRTVTVLPVEQTFVITVSSASSGNGNRYFVNGVEAPALQLDPGKTYVFDLSDTSTGNHPLAFNPEDVGWTLDITSVGKRLLVTVPENVSGTGAYYCTAHPGMGNLIAFGDTTAPVISVTSGNDTVELESSWTDAGATADTGETVTASGIVDTSVPGTYTITYTATDPAGNTGTATRTVTVVIFGDVVVYPNTSTTLIGQVTIEGEVAESGDVVAIYVGSELRAKQEVIIFGGEAWVNALVNVAGGNETISFKVYDASTGVTHAKSNTSAVVTSGGTVGSSASPLMIEMKDYDTQTLNLKAGWNLVSFYVDGDDMTPATVFAPIQDKLLEVKNLTQSYDPTRDFFLNTLSSLSVKDGYWLKVSEDASLDVEGRVLSGASINVNSGWNLVGYPRLSGEAVADELTSLGNTVVQIKYLESSYVPGVPSFLNTLSTMAPGSGYWLNVNADGTWVLGDGGPSFASFKTRSNDSPEQKVGPIWSEPVVYPNLGVTVLAKVSIQGKPVAKGGVVAAFVGNELRGLQDVVLNDGMSYVTLNVNLNGEESVSYRVWNPDDYNEYLVSGTMLLEPGNVYGNPKLMELDAVTVVDKPLQVFKLTSEPFGFSFNTAVGRSYTVEATGDLRSWKAVELFQGSGGEIRFTAKPTSRGKSQFFRVLVE